MPRAPAHAAEGSRPVPETPERDPSALELRAAVDADLPALTDIYNHYILHTSATFDIEPFTVERRRTEWFSKYAPAGPYRIVVAAEAGRLVGFAYSSPFRPKAAYRSSVETSVYCAPGCTGRGLGRRLYEALFEQLAHEHVHRAFALITRPNQPSESLHMRMGFTLAGVWPEVGHKFGRYWDVAVWQRLVSPPPPRPS